MQSCGRAAITNLRLTRAPFLLGGSRSCLTKPHFFALALSRFHSLSVLACPPFLMQWTIVNRELLHIDNRNSWHVSMCWVDEDVRLMLDNSGRDAKE